MCVQYPRCGCGPELRQAYNVRLLFRQQGQSGEPAKADPYSEDPGSRFFPAPSLFSAAPGQKNPAKCQIGKELSGKFPGFPAPFPACGCKSAVFGQNLQKFCRLEKKIPAKFPAPGNLRAAAFAQFGSHHKVAEGTKNRFPQPFSAVCQAEGKGLAHVALFEKGCHCIAGNTVIGMSAVPLQASLLVPASHRLDIVSIEEYALAG